MAKTEMTKLIESKLWKINAKQGNYGCFEVSIGVGWNANGIVDFITYDSKGEFRCYEIKVSKSDFHSKAKLSFHGDFNYYVMPFSLLYELRKDTENEVKKINFYKDKDTSKLFDERIKNSGIGLIAVTDNGNLVVEVNPKRQQVKMGMRATLLESMVRSLNREVKKSYKVTHYWDTEKSKILW